MKKIDASKLLQAVQEEKHRQAMVLRKNVSSHREIAEFVGVHPGTVCRWYTSVNREGLSTIKARRRGNQTGGGAIWACNRNTELSTCE